MEELKIRLENLERAFLMSQQKNIENTLKTEENCMTIELVKASMSGEYSEKQTYTDGMYCLQNGNLYRFKQMQGRGIEPQNETYWELCDVASELNRIVNMITK